MNKVCYICGQTIGPRQLYYKIGKNSYICEEKWCYEQYVWDSYAARYTVDRDHECAVINGVAYSIGNEDDSPRGFSGREFVVRFNDGTTVVTHSLWRKGEVPARYLSVLQNNAEFITMEDL